MHGMEGLGLSYIYSLDGKASEFTIDWKKYVPRIRGDMHVTENTNSA